MGRCRRLNEYFAPCSYATFQLNYVLGDGGRTYLAGYSKNDIKYYWHKMVRRQHLHTHDVSPSKDTHILTVECVCLPAVRTQILPLYFEQ